MLPQITLNRHEWVGFYVNLSKSKVTITVQILYHKYESQSYLSQSHVIWSEWMGEEITSIRRNLWQHEYGCDP
jgi:hypothetical protein